MAYLLQYIGRTINPQSELVSAIDTEYEDSQSYCERENHPLALIWNGIVQCNCWCHIGNQNAVTLADKVNDEYQGVGLIGTRY